MQKKTDPNDIALCAGAAYFVNGDDCKYFLDNTAHPEKEVSESTSLHHRLSSPS